MGPGGVIPAWFLATRVETTCMTASPSEFPNCDAVLNTAPAIACLSSGKVSVTMMRPTVKSTSTENGMRIWAKKAPVQYVDWGWIKAMSRGEPAVRREVMTVSHTAGILCTTSPVVKLSAIPTTTDGTIRSAACNAENR